MKFSFSTLSSGGFGIGTDIEDIKRFRKLNIRKDRNFLDKIYTDQEIKFCFSKKNFAQHLAVRFSAKEAVYKALFSLIHKPITLKDIEISNSFGGVPTAAVKDIKFRGCHILVSLAHCRDKALAFALVWR